MKMLGLSLMGIVALGLPTAHADHPRCTNLARGVETIIRDSSSASQELQRDAHLLGELSASLNRASSKLSAGGGGVDLRRELGGMVSDARRKSGEIASVIRTQIGELNQTFNEGSEAYHRAGRVGNALAALKSNISAAGDRLDALKNRASQLQDNFNQEGSLQGLKSRLLSEIRSADRIPRLISDLAVVGRLDRATRDYTGTCSSSSDFSCGSIRSELERSASRAAGAERSLDRDAVALDRALDDADRAAEGIQAGGGSVDIVSIIHGAVHREAIPAIQDTYNDVALASQKCLEASTANSGVLHEQLVRESLGLLNKGISDLSRFESGLSDVERAIDSAQQQLGNSGANAGVARELSRSAREINGLERSIDSIVRGLGSAGWSSTGDLGATDQSFKQHRSRCELR